MREIINLLVESEYYGVSHRVDTAKGLYKIPYSYGQFTKLMKRIWKINKNGY
jgi:hypothetical protein